MHRLLVMIILWMMISKQKLLIPIIKSMLIMLIMLTIIMGRIMTMVIIKMIMVNRMVICLEQVHAQKASSEKQESGVRKTLLAVIV